jgi:hypothetical protein
MPAGFELWDTDTNNLLDDWDTEAQAIEALRGLIELNGPEAMHDLALVSVDDAGVSSTVAYGAALVPHVARADADAARRTV